MKQKPIKLVVTDLDDTLLSPTKEISQNAIAEIRLLKEKGVKFTFITGRPPYAILRFAKQVDLTAPVVGCNGALMAHKGFPMELEPLNGLLQAAHEKKLTVLVLAGDTEYALGETKWTMDRKAADRALPFASIEDLSQKDSIYKVNIMSSDCQDGFAALLPQIEKLQAMYNITTYGTSGCEIVAKGINKKTGLIELCRLCGVEMAEVLAIGDNENDIEMLKSAGTSAAVRNASPGAKAAAGYVCKAAYTEGFIEAIHKFVL